MKNLKVYQAGWLGILFLFLMLVSCTSEQDMEVISTESSIFPKGNKGPEQFFTGTVWVKGLVENDSVFTTAAGNVLFESAARSNWHSHPAGQILIVTEGVGYHQIRGEPKEIIRKGDVVKCPPNTAHWHGASRDQSMSHIYLLPNTEKGMVEWMEAVTDEDYLSE